MKKVLYSLLLCALCTVLRAQDLNTWTHFYAYNALTHVVPTSGSVYVLSAGRLFAYNPGDETVAEYNTINLLSDHSTITDICWNRQAQCLVIAYENGNLDLLDTKTLDLVNNAAIVKETTTRSKRINTMLAYDDKVYLVMDYGIITVNARRREIGDTYRFNTGSATCTGVWAEGDSIFLMANRALPDYGATVIGGRVGDNLLDKSKWTPASPQRRQQVERAVAADKQSRTITSADSKIEDTFHNCFWGADTDNSLMLYAKADDGTFTQQWQRGRKPYGPASNDFYIMHWVKGRLYTVGRGWRTKVDSNEPGITQVYSPDTQGWMTFDTPSRDELGFNFVATSDIAVDPRDTAHVMVSTKSGVYEYRSGKYVKRWDKSNSPIKGLGDTDSRNFQLVLGSAYDANGTLWVLNSACSNGLLSLDQGNGVNAAPGTWTHHPTGDLDRFAPYVRFLANPVFDKSGRLWFININYDDITFYSYDPASATLTTYRPNMNQDGTTLYDDSGDGFLRHINVDNEGNIWIAGTKGIAYLPADETGTATTTVRQHKIARNDGTGLADYLLSTVDATCIIFDSSNRKYVATEGAGIYLISSDNNGEVQHYTTANSHLMSDNVRYLALDEATGTLYCSTDRGLCAVRTDGITVPTTLDEDNIHIYPNPVTPDYSGMITIEGLTVGADIKITTATGYIVHTGRTASAIYQWDGCDRSGKRCASGVYNILLATQDGEEGCVAKIAMVK